MYWLSELDTTDKVHMLDLPAGSQGVMGLSSFSCGCKMTQQWISRKPHGKVKKDQSNFVYFFLNHGEDQQSGTFSHYKAIWLFKKRYCSHLVIKDN